MHGSLGCPARSLDRHQNAADTEWERVFFRFLARPGPPGGTFAQISLADPCESPAVHFCGLPLAPGGGCSLE